MPIYQRGEKPLPDVPRAASVKDFGAKGDGQADDTAGIPQGAGDGGARRDRGPAGPLPHHRHPRDHPAEPRAARAGPDKAVLVFPKPLNDIKPNWGATTDARRTSNYSWSGGFVWLRSSYGEKTLATVGGAAKRGDHSVTVSSASPLRVGQSVLLRVSDTPDKLARAASVLRRSRTDRQPQRRHKGPSFLALRITAVEGAHRVRPPAALRHPARVEAGGAPFRADGNQSGVRKPLLLVPVRTTRSISPR